jgi:hypothetical protein
MKEAFVLIVTADPEPEKRAILKYGECPIPADDENYP